MPVRYQIDRFSVSNFRSIRDCDVRLVPLTVIVGPNSSGKSNFVRSISFLAIALKDPLDKVIAGQHGVYALFCHPVTFPSVMRFAVEISSTSGIRSSFALEIEATDATRFVVKREECRVSDENGEGHYYLVENGKASGSSPVFPAVSMDRIFLTNASGLPEFRAVYDFLSGISVTQPATTDIYDASDRLNAMTRALGGRVQPTGFLHRFKHLREKHPEAFDVVQDYLRAISPSFQRITLRGEADKQSLHFYEKSGAGGSAGFSQSHMSAGFLHSAEMLLSLFTPNDDDSPLSPVILEEPEALLHPGAINALRDSFIEASKLRQIIMTSHSPEFLDDPELSPDSIRSVSRDDAGTHIVPLDEATKSVLTERLSTAGELLRSGALTSQAQ
jgi:predicted ATPase